MEEGTNLDSLYSSSRVSDLLIERVPGCNPAYVLPKEILRKESVRCRREDRRITQAYICSFHADFFD